MGKPHKHADLIKLWADGAEIEYRDRHEQADWDTMTVPYWNCDWIDFRIKPEPKPDVVRFVTYEWNPINERTYGGVPDHKQGQFSNLKLTFDRATGKLKSAEVL